MSTNVSSHPDLDDATRARLRAQLMRKGRAVAEALADLLAGKDLDLSRIVSPREGLDQTRPEERLRAWLDLLESKRALLDARDPIYGRCQACGEPLLVAVLEQTPWADTCLECAGTGSAG